MIEQAQAASVTRTLRLRVKREVYPWLRAAAVQVSSLRARERVFVIAGSVEQAA